MTEQPTDAPGRLIYLNGRLVPAEEARISIADHGLLYGLGFFETFRTSGGKPHLWDQHRRRLLEACATARIEVPRGFLAHDELKLREIVRAQLTEHGVPDGVFRYTLTAGAPATGGGKASYTEPSEWLALRPLPPSAPAEGVSLRVLQLRRDRGEWTPRPKSLNFANALLGGQELRRRSVTAHDEGLFLAQECGWVVESPWQNVAWVAGGRCCFPDPALGAVAGTCLQWLRERGFAAQPCRASLDEFCRAEAVVLLNSVRGVTPVRALWDANDEAQIGSWESSGHPLVVSLGREWSAGLQETASIRFKPSAGI